ncbi:hypothetical protein BD626DRAFT_564040 [Schizophyllum amplum]|uniref:Uncharacterized protein n=1 Tax=Schizophyllum amplum TaxID=97359 RepID=A0A550D049_9AGAR|nr:hypothetical protein BD626DRAFT_564040 [Auriculariopsis ampla]
MVEKPTKVAATQFTLSATLDALADEQRGREAVARHDCELGDKLRLAYDDRERALRKSGTRATRAASLQALLCDAEAVADSFRDAEAAIDLRTSPPFRRRIPTLPHEFIARTQRRHKRDRAFGKSEMTAGCIRIVDSSFIRAAASYYGRQRRGYRLRGYIPCIILILTSAISALLTATTPALLALLAGPHTAGEGWRVAVVLLGDGSGDGVLGVSAGHAHLGVGSGSVTGEVCAKVLADPAVRGMLAVPASTSTPATAASTSANPKAVPGKAPGKRQQEGRREARLYEGPDHISFRGG